MLLFNMGKITPILLLLVTFLSLSLESIEDFAHEEASAISVAIDSTQTLSVATCPSCPSAEHREACHHASDLHHIAYKEALSSLELFHSQLTSLQWYYAHLHSDPDLLSDNDPPIFG